MKVCVLKYALSVFVAVFAIVGYYLFIAELPEVPMSTIERITSYGYKGEDHVATTNDGYSLHLHRISLREKTRYGKPVLILPGVSATSDIMMLLGPKEDLPFLIADQEQFDVWIGNYRGTIHGLPNPQANLTSDQQRFFGFHELGVYDLPAMIDYILQATGHKSLRVIGCSFGNTVLLITLSELPQYNAVIEKGIFLQPMTPCSERSNWFEWFFLPFSQNRIVQVSVATFEEFALFDKTRRAFLAYHFCNSYFLKFWCKALIGSVASHEFTEDDSINTLIFNYMPAGYSAGLIAQYETGHKEGKILKPHYGEEENVRIYGQKLPPEYNTSNIKIPAVAFYTEHDSTVTLKCILKAISYVPNIRRVYRVQSPFVHGQFLMNSTKDMNFVHNIIKELGI